MTSSPTITNLTSMKNAEAATEKLGAILNGKTYMDLQVDFAPVGGCFNIFVTGSDSETEVLSMTMELLAAVVIAA